MSETPIDPNQFNLANATREEVDAYTAGHEDRTTRYPIFGVEASRVGQYEPPLDVAYAAGWNARAREE